MNSKQQLALLLKQFVPYAEAFKQVADDLEYLGNLDQAKEQAERSLQAVELNSKRVEDQLQKAKEEAKGINEQVGSAQAEGQKIIAEAKAKAQDEGRQIIEKAQAAAAEWRKQATASQEAVAKAAADVKAAVAELERIKTEMSQLRARIA